MNDSQWTCFWCDLFKLSAYSSFRFFSLCLNCEKLERQFLDGYAGIKSSLTLGHLVEEKRGCERLLRSCWDEFLTSLLSLFLWWLWVVIIRWLFEGRWVIFLFWGLYFFYFYFWGLEVVFGTRLFDYLNMAWMKRKCASGNGVFLSRIV